MRHLALPLRAGMVILALLSGPLRASAQPKLTPAALLLSPRETTATATAAKEARLDTGHSHVINRMSDHLGTMRYQFGNLIGQANISHR